jgi:hypothetical protein
MTLEREFYLKETNTEAEHWWLTPVTLAIQDIEIVRVVV